jgi:hypothetical protein
MYQVEKGGYAVGMDEETNEYKILVGIFQKLWKLKR